MSDSIPNAVPEPPKEQIVIEQKDLKRLMEWIEFFKALSPRISLLVPGSDDFNSVYEQAPSLIRKLKKIEDDYDLVGWPDRECIAFIVSINSALSDSKPLYKIPDYRVFCFGDYAFGMAYFEWDGDAEEGNWVRSYSLSKFPSRALTWHYIKELIINQIKELEAQVPEFK